MPSLAHVQPAAALHSRQLPIFLPVAVGLDGLLASSGTGRRLVSRTGRSHGAGWDSPAQAPFPGACHQPIRDQYPTARFPVAGILADHVHLVLGCPIQVAPDEVVLGFLNNLAFVQGMRPIYQFGGFVGTVGEYTTNAW